MTVVEKWVKAADDQMRRRQACKVGEQRRSAPVALLLRAFEIGFPDPAHLRLRQTSAAAKALPRVALGVGRVDPVDQQLKPERALTGIAQREIVREREVAAGGIASDRKPRRI